jgi:hypothetical protein
MKRVIQQEARTMAIVFEVSAIRLIDVSQCD